MRHLENPIIIGGLLLFITFAGVIAIASQNGQPVPIVFKSKQIEYIDAESYQNLINVFELNTPHNYTITKSIPADFPTLKDTKLKKRLFVKMLTPIIEVENQKVIQQRNLVKLLLNDGKWPKNKKLKRQITSIAQLYKVRTKDAEKAREILLSRVDSLPLKLILSQAAIESGWGTSRFALEGNSLFGQWSFVPGAGLTPNEREEGLNHEVKAFKDLQSSIHAYLLNINTNNAYTELRHMRKAMRKNDHQLNAYELAKGLHRYSQRKHEYVDEIRRILKQKVITNATVLATRG